MNEIPPRDRTRHAELAIESVHGLSVCSVCLEPLTQCLACRLITAPVAQSVSEGRGNPRRRRAVRRPEVAFCLYVLDPTPEEYRHGDRPFSGTRHGPEHARMDGRITAAARQGDSFRRRKLLSLSAVAVELLALA